MKNKLYKNKQKSNKIIYKKQINFLENKGCEDIEIEIESININGEGIGFYNGKKVCVKNVLLGEKVLCKKIVEKNNFIFAKTIKILNKSTKRVDSLCPYYNDCGGCDFQHINSSDLLKLKKEIFKDYFKNVIDEEIDINVHKSENDFYYRNKISFCVDKDMIGLYKEGSKKIIQIKKCIIADKKINEILEICSQWLKEIKNENNLIKNIVVRTLNNNFIITIVIDKTIINLNNDLESILKIEKNDENLLNNSRVILKDEYQNSNLKFIKSINIHSLINLINQKNENNFGIYLNFNKSKEEILGKDWLYIFGLTNLKSEMCGITYFVHPYSFLQVNNYVEEILYKRVLDFIEDKQVIEGYSGCGLLSAIMSKKAKSVLSIEINKQSTLNANAIKKINNIKNLENINGDCTQKLVQLSQKYKDAIFVIDPPQVGCNKKILQALIDSQIDKIIYISCNPYTLKQDIVFLSDYYKVCNLEIFDMFPQTSHIETLCILKKNKIQISII